MKRPDPQKLKYCQLYQTMAKAAAQQTEAKRHQVGGVLVTPSGAIFTGWNGTLPGDDNNCETGEYLPAEGRRRTGNNVVHAEHNIIAWASRSGVPLEGSHLYITRAPCPSCALMLLTHGITAVYYEEMHDDLKGLKILGKHGVELQDWVGQRDALRALYPVPEFKLGGSNVLCIRLGCTICHGRGYTEKGYCPGKTPF